VTREPKRLYTTQEIADTLGVKRSWVHVHLRMARDGVPLPDFIASTRGKHLGNLWTEQSLVRWQAYHAGTGASPTRRYDGYSDHNAVNRIGPLTVTWKLWWQPAATGDSTTWWLSSPAGWWVSTDDGESWWCTELMIRPTDNRYISVNSCVKNGTVLANVLASIAGVREQVEGSVRQ
jgi:hypothetical protein